MAEPLTPSQVCGTLSSLNSLATATLSTLTSRLYALKELSNILEASTTRLPQLPDASALIPIHLIDRNVYNQLAEACPGLLPPLPTDPTVQILRLQQMVQDAYVSLYSQLTQHPLAKMAKLDAELSELINKAGSQLTSAIIPPIGIVQCLEAICNAAGVTPQPPSALVTQVQSAIIAAGQPTPIEGAAAQTGGNASTTTSGISALSTSQQSKVTQFKNLQQTLANLGGVTIATLPAAPVAEAAPVTAVAQNTATPKVGVIPTYTSASFNGGGGGGSGSVTSVGLSMPTGFTVTNSPITGAGVLKVTTALAGIIRGNGSEFITAIPGTDYIAPGSILSAGLTAPPSALLGRYDPTAGPVESITIGTNLILANGTLNATGSGGGGGGSVSSVSLSMPGGFTVSGSPITSSGTLAVTTTLIGVVKGTGSALAAATAGSDYVAPGSVTSSGLTTPTNSLLGRYDAGTGAIETIVPGSGLVLSGGTLISSGGVSSVGLSMPSGFSVSGSPITSSGTLAVTTALSGIIKGTGSGLTVASAGTDYLAPSSFPIQPTQGGTGLISYNTGDILYASGTNTLAKLPIGGSGQQLIVGSGVPQWNTPAPAVNNVGGILYLWATYT